MKTRTFFVVSGNINGNEDEALIGATRAQADTLVCGRVLGALGEMGFVNADGGFSRVAATLYFDGGPNGPSALTVHSAGTLSKAIAELDGDRHVFCATLRRLNAKERFAEWKVSEPKA